MLYASAGTSASSSSGGGNFLIPNGTFVVELIIFLIVLGIISKWILPPLQAVSETRRAGIRNAQATADSARAESQRLLAERERVLGEARAQARALIDDANHGADQAFEQARQRGQDEYERLLDLARADTANDCRRVRDELVRRLDTLVVASAERVLGGRVDASRHRVLIDDAIATAARQS
jgi:F-type H+-transporting ATPase subunit b